METWQGIFSFHKEQGKQNKQIQGINSYRKQEQQMTEW